MIVDRHTKDLVKCNNLNEFVKFVKESRCYEGKELLYKVGIDGGGRFLKFSLSVFPCDEDEDESESKKNIYSGSLSTKIKDSGVNSRRYSL